MSLRRRRLLTAALPAALSGRVLAQAKPTPSHDPFGPLRPPQPMPDLTLTGDDGKRFGLDARLRGRISAVQLMFTGCSATCPIQGALFAALAPQVATAANMQLLSISIDPLGDPPAALHEWLGRFGRHPNWRAAVPRVEDTDKLLDFLRGRATGADRHTAQIYLIDRQARLAYRTAEMPPARFVVDLMSQLDRMR
jgi:protein SCO1/2